MFQAGSELNKREVKFDNLYDVIFDSVGNAKPTLHKKLIITGDRLDFLEQCNIHIVETPMSKPVVEVDKLKISK